MTNIKGITIELEGDATGLTQALKQVDGETKKVQSELKQVDRLLKFDPTNIELLSQKQQLLGDAINSTTMRLDALKQAQGEVERQFANGEIGADQYRAFQREIAATEGKLRAFKAQADAVDVKIDAQADTTAIDKMKGKLGEVADVAKDVSGKIGENLKTGAKVGAAAIAGIGAAAAGAVVGVSAFVESQKEMSMDMARLKTNADQAGMSMDKVNEAWTKVSAISGEADSAVEAVSNLLATGMDDNQLAQALDYVNGAAIKFSDTLKTEGIADGLQETFASGKAIGPFAELLERSGVNLEVFDAGLAKAQKSGEGMDYILQQLSQLGLKETYDSYMQNNQAIADYNLAQAESQRKLAEFSDLLRPFVTTLMEMGNIILDVVLGNKSLAEGFGELVDILQGLSEKFLSAAKDSMPSFIKGIQDALPQVLEAGVKILTKIVEGIASKYPTILSTGLEVVNKLGTTLINNLPKLLDAGVKLLTSIIGGITGNLPKLVATALNLVLKLASTIITNLPKIIDAGVKIVTSIVSGIGKALPQIVSYLVGTFIPKLFKTITSADWLQIGKDIINGLIKGIKNMTKSAVEAITGVVDSVVNAAKKLLGIKSPSRVFKQIGLWTGEGMAIGIDGSSSTVNKAMENIGDGIISVSEKFQKEYSNLIDDFNSKNEDKNDKTLQKIEKIRSTAAKKKRDLTAKELQEIALLEASYRDGKIKSDREFNEKYLSLVQQSEKEYLEVVKTYIDEKKSLDQLSLLDEVAIWEQSTELFNEGSKERLTAQKSYKTAVEAVNKELTAINKEYSDQIVKVNEDLVKSEEALNKAYDDAVTKRASSLVNFKGIFDEFKFEIGATGEELMSNLQSQVSAFEEWQRQIDMLSDKAINKGLLAELKEMGPNALPQLIQLNSMTDKQLTEYSNLYEKKSKLAREQAEKELKGMKDDTEKQIKAMQLTARTQLSVLNSEWAEKIRGLTKTTGDELSSLEKVGRDAGNGLLRGLASTEGALQSKAQQIADSISRTIKDALQIKSPSRVMKGFGVNVGEGLVIGMDDMIRKVSQSSSRLSDAVANAQGSLTNSKMKSQQAKLVSSTVSSATVDNSKYMQPNITIINQAPNASPSELARKAIQEQRQLAMEWGI